MRTLVACLLCSLTPLSAGAQAAYSVTNSGNVAYLVNGMSNPNLTLVRGHTYTFNVNASSHPFYIKTKASTGTGDRFDTGVTGQGATAGAVVFNVPPSAPNTLFYHCSAHSGMGGTLNIKDVGAVDVPGVGAPGTLWLANAVPNPVHEGTMLRFGLPRPARIAFTIIDPGGRAIRVLARGDWPSGDHALRWDGRDEGGNRVPSGLYFSRLKAEGMILSGRVTVTR